MPNPSRRDYSHLKQQPSAERVAQLRSIEQAGGWFTPEPASPAIEHLRFAPPPSVEALAEIVDGPAAPEPEIGPKQVALAWQRPSVRGEARVLLMALLAVTPRRGKHKGEYGDGWVELAGLMGYITEPEHYDDAAKQKVKRAVTALLDAGALEVIRPGSRSRNAVYRIK